MGDKKEDFIIVDIVRRNYKNFVYYIIVIDGILEVAICRDDKRRLAISSATDLAACLYRDTGRQPSVFREAFGPLKIHRSILISAPETQNVGEETSATLFNVAEGRLEDLDALISQWVRRGIKNTKDGKAIVDSFSI